jgi:hypothetical protein
VLDAKLEALADALIAKALEGDVAALREAIHQLVGRPTEVVSGHPERPVRVVVESISSRRREALADVEADAAEVEELPPGRKDAMPSRSRSACRSCDQENFGALVVLPSIELMSRLLHGLLSGRVRISRATCCGSSICT